jgi:hypothetical protein
MVFSSVIGAAALAAVGCEEGTTQKDVADARQNLDEARQETRETAQEGREEVADARQEAQEHTAAKPVTPDENADARNEVADARQEASEEVAEAKNDERHAAAELRTTEQQHQATQERDAFVKQAEEKLADYDKQIESLQQEASNAEGANKDAITVRIDGVKAQRDIAEKAVSDLKSADLATWKNHQDHVRLAFQDLDNSMKTVR